MAFTDIYVRPCEEPVFSYRSGSAVYEESFLGGALLARGWNAAGYPLDVLSNCASNFDYNLFSRATAFAFNADGVCLDTFWKYIGFEKQPAPHGVKGVITLESTVKPLRLTVTTVLDGSAMLERYLTLENLSDGFINISDITLMGGGLDVPEIMDLTKERELGKFYSVGVFETDYWGHEGRLKWYPLTEGRHSYETRFGRDRFRHPIAFVRNNLTGMLWFAQTAFSGGCAFTADLRQLNDVPNCALSFDAAITGYAPLIALRPHEVFELPHVHMGAVIGGTDDAVNQMNEHMRKSVFTVADGTANLVGAGMGAEHDMSVSTSESFIRQFEEMGAEVFIIDAGWECPPTKNIDWYGYNGVNVPNPDRYPNDGFARLREYCHAHHLKFACWVEIERLGDKCGLYEQHPEWFAYSRYGRRANQFLDFTRPEVAAWAESELARIIEQYGLELLRVDYNIGPWEFFAMRDTTGTGHPECVVLRHYKAVTDMYTKLKKRFPDVVFENCAGGGGRTDAAQLTAFNHSWVSDWQVPPRSALITYGMTAALPPERVDRLFAGMGCHKYGSLAFHMRNVMLTHMSLNVMTPATAAYNDESMAFVKHSVQLYKEFIRPFLPESKVWHLTGDVIECEQNGFAALEISGSDRAALAAFTLTGGGRDETVYPKGLENGAEYRVTYDNDGSFCVRSGADIMKNGIRIALPASLMSELVTFEKV